MSKVNSLHPFAEPAHLEKPATHLSAKAEEYPDGGPRAYLAVFGAFLALFCSFGQITAFGTFQSWYETHQLSALPPSKISWIGALQLWAFFFSGAPIGKMYDAWGPTWLMASGTATCVLSLVGTSFVKRYGEYLLVQGVLFGLGTGLLFYPALAGVSTYFFRYKATALGIAAAGSSCGGVVYPIMLQRLFDEVGFSWGVRISTLVGGLGCAIATLCVTHRVVPQTDGSTLSSKRKGALDRPFLYLCLGSFLVAAGLFIPLFYIVDYARAMSIPPDTALYFLAAMNAGGVFGRIGPAYLADTLGRFNLLIPAAFLSGLSCLAIWLPTRSAGTLMAFAVLYGITSGAFIAGVTPCVAQISDGRRIGARIGWLYTVLSLPSLLGGPAAGALLAKTGEFDALVVLAGSTVVLGSVALCCSKFAIDSRMLAKV